MITQVKQYIFISRVPLYTQACFYDQTRLCNISPISLRQKNDKLNKPPTPDYVSKLLEQLSNINVNDQITLDPEKNALLNKGKLNFKKGQLISYTLNNVPYTVEILNQAGKTTGSCRNSFNIEYKHLDEEDK